MEDFPFPVTHEQSPVKPGMDPAFDKGPIARRDHGKDSHGLPDEGPPFFGQTLAGPGKRTPLPDAACGVEVRMVLMAA